MIRLGTNDARAYHEKMIALAREYFENCYDGRMGAEIVDDLLSVSGALVDLSFAVEGFGEKWEQND